MWILKRGGCQSFFLVSLCSPLSQFSHTLNYAIMSTQGSLSVRGKQAQYTGMWTICLIGRTGFTKRAKPQVFCCLDLVAIVTPPTSHPLPALPSPQLSLCLAAFFGSRDSYTLRSISLKFLNPMETLAHYFHMP